MTEGRSDDFRKNFLVTHFFNPVRKMKLVEVIRGQDTSDSVTNRVMPLSTFLDRRVQLFSMSKIQGRGDRQGVDNVKIEQAAVGLDGGALEIEVEAALAAESRPAAHAERDRNRKPLETLKFFGLEDDDLAFDLTGWLHKDAHPLGEESIYRVAEPK